MTITRAQKERKAKIKKAVLWIVLSAFIMIALPWLTVRFVRGDAGMAVCFVLFFALDPLWSSVLGVFSGGDPKARWFLPILSAAFFLAGTWLCFDPGEKAFLLYAAIYLILGGAAMLISFYAKKRRQ